MGVPKIDITFKELTSTAVARSSRGAVALLLEDTTVNEPAVFLREKEDIDPAKWTEKSAAAIAIAVAWLYPAWPVVLAIGLLCFLIAALRVLSGQHYPSDVFAALVLSGAISLAGYLL